MDSHPAEANKALQQRYVLRPFIAAFAVAPARGHVS
jgi:hypothetical protein